MWELQESMLKGWGSGGIWSASCSSQQRSLSPSTLHAALSYRARLSRATWRDNYEYGFDAIQGHVGL
jgi:hypothetical protein